MSLHDVSSRAVASLSGTARLVLGMVGIGRRTGYEIKRLVDRSTRFFWSASPGQIYPELRRLEAAGLLTRAEQPQGDRPRSVYSLTSAGEEALHRWLIDPELTFEQRNEGLLKLFFADALSAEEQLGVVRAMRARHESILDGIRRATPLYSAEQRFRYVAWRYGLGIHGWIVDWCRELERELAEARPLLQAGEDERAASAS